MRRTNNIVHAWCGAVLAWVGGNQIGGKRFYGHNLLDVVLKRGHHLVVFEVLRELALYWKLGEASEGEVPNIRCKAIAQVLLSACK